MQMRFDVTNRCYYWLIEHKGSDIVVSPEFKSEERALDWYSLISDEILKEHGVYDESHD
jgi:hypothetical protein